MMKISTAKRRINKTIDELFQSLWEDFKDGYKRGYIDGYTDCSKGEKSKYQPITQAETQNSNLTFEKDECAKEYEELGLKELKELIEADRKTEPQTCDTCKWGEWYRKGYDITMMDDECGGCCSWHSKWTPKTEQTEETEMDRLERIDNEIEDAWARIRELTEEPQTDDKDTNVLNKPQTDCDRYVIVNDEGERAYNCIGCQTDCGWK